MDTKKVLAELRKRVAREGQTAVADDLGVSRSYICHILAGNRPPTLALAERLGFRFVMRAPSR